MIHSIVYLGEFQKVYAGGGSMGEKEEEVIIYTANLWHSGGKWVIPIPRHIKPLLKKNKLYKLIISIREIPFSIVFSETSSKALQKERVFIEVTKIWKMGDKYAFPVRKETADLLAPLILEIREVVKREVEKSKIGRAKRRLLSEDKRYLKLWEKVQSLQDEKNRVIGEIIPEDSLDDEGWWDHPLTPEEKEEIKRKNEEKEKQIKEIEAKIDGLLKKARVIEEETTERAKEIAKELTPNIKENQILAWAKRPLKIKAIPFEIIDPEDAIELYRKAPFGLEEEEPKNLPEPWEWVV